MRCRVLVTGYGLNLTLRAGGFMDAIVLAGGFGIRLSHIVKDVPKPMTPVAGKPFWTQ